MAKSIYLTTFDFDTFKNDTFKSVIFDFFDELGNFKQKQFYTFDFYTFKRDFGSPIYFNILGSKVLVHWIEPNARFGCSMYVNFSTPNKSSLWWYCRPTTTSENQLVPSMAEWWWCQWTVYFGSDTSFTIYILSWHWFFHTLIFFTLNITDFCCCRGKILLLLLLFIYLC